MTVEKAVARISGQPRGEISAGRFRLAALVTNMGETVRTMRVVRVRSDGFLYLHAGRRKLPILGQRHGMIREEPEVIAVMRGQAVHQHCDLMLLSDAARGADRPFGFAALATTSAS